MVGTMTSKCIVCKIVALLAGIGALNWALVAFFGINLVTTVLGDMTLPAKVVYGLVGVSGLMTIITLIKPICPACK